MVRCGTVVRQNLVALPSLIYMPRGRVYLEATSQSSALHPCFVAPVDALILPYKLALMKDTKRKDLKLSLLPTEFSVAQVRQTID